MLAAMFFNASTNELVNTDKFQTCHNKMFDAANLPDCLRGNKIFGLLRRLLFESDRASWTLDEDTNP